MHGYGGVLAFVETGTYFFGCVYFVIEVRNEGGDGALEVDVVLPEGIVCVKKKCLMGQA